MQLEQIVIVVIEVQGHPLTLHSGTRGLDLSAERPQPRFVLRKVGLIYLECNMAIGPLGWLALHEGKPYATEKKELLARKGEILSGAIVDLPGAKACT
jgi:hypothetical protein